MLHTTFSHLINPLQTIIPPFSLFNHSHISNAKLIGCIGLKNTRIIGIDAKHNIFIITLGIRKLINRMLPDIGRRGRITKQPGILLISWKKASSMSEHDVLKKNRNFYIGVGGTVLEGLLSGSLFMLLYSVMQFLWSGQFDMNRALILTGVIAVIFLLRILIYSYGYTKAQIGGAEVSKNIRLFMGDHLKRIPLSRFTQGQTGDYINTITSDVNN